jgi:hypothetical protein
MFKPYTSAQIPKAPLIRLGVSGRCINITR